MALVALNFTCVDGKGQESVVTLYTTDSFTLPQLVAAGIAMVPLVRNMITGGIISCSLSVDIDLATLFGSFPTIPVPDADSDTEEGALFIFRTSGNHDKRNRFPTFDENLFFAGTREVDVAHAQVAPFITAIQSGVSAGGATVTFVDSRLEDIVSTDDAYESFQSSRRRG